MPSTPISPERCGHVAPMALERAADGYSARCLRCETGEGSALGFAISGVWFSLGRR
jgi:hypothetical protein